MGLSDLQRPNCGYKLYTLCTPPVCHLFFARQAGFLESEPEPYRAVHPRPNQVRSYAIMGLASTFLK